MDYQTSNPLVGMSIRACIGQDVDCLNPISSAALTNDSGQAILKVNGNILDGYAELVGAGYPTTLLFFPPITSDFVTRRLPLPSKSVIAFTTANIGGDQPNAAELTVQVLDCNGELAGGVSVELEPNDGATRFYFRNRIPSAAATETDELGAAAGFVNVKTRTALTLRAKVVENGLSLPPMTVQARADGTLTLVQMYARF
jgi:hypothetical protein